jgi:hypothetical protein
MHDNIFYLSNVRKVVAMKESTENQQNEIHQTTPIGRAIGVAIAVIGASIFMFLIWNIFFNFVQRGEMLCKHFVAIVGIPVAAATAFAIVVFLRQTEGRLDFQGLGFKFNSASGQVAMWVVCFLALVGAIRLLWFGDEPSCLLH